MKKISLLIIMIILITGCNNIRQTNEEAKFSDSDISFIQSNLSSSNLTPCKETITEHTYEILYTYNIDNILNENGYSKYSLTKFIGYNSDFLYLLICNEYNYYSLVVYDRNINKVIEIGSSYKYDFVSNCIAVNINDGHNSKIYLFANTYNGDKSINLDILVFNVDIYNCYNTKYDEPSVIFQEKNIIEPIQSTHIKSDSINKIAFTCNTIVENNYADSIYTINIEDNSTTNLITTNYNVNNNKYTGEKIMCIGGINTLYYQTATLANENLNEAKNFTINSNSLSNNSSPMPLKYTGAFSYINGRMDNIFAINNKSNELQCFSLMNNTHTILPIIDSINTLFIDKFYNENDYIIFNEKSISIFDTVNRTYSSIDCVGDKKRDFYIDKDFLLNRINIGENTSTYKLNRHEFSFVYEENSENYVVIYGEDIPSYSKDLDEKLKNNIKLELLSPYVELIHETDKYIFYKETSSKSYKSADRIIWKYDKALQSYKKLYQYVYYIGYNQTLSPDNKYIIISEEYKDDVKINIETGELIVENTQGESIDFITKIIREPFYLTNIPYDKSINYTINPVGNFINGSRVIADNEHIYYINTKDENKLYKIDKNGQSSEKVYDSSVSCLQMQNDEIYFLNKDKDNENSNLLCSINKDGSNFKMIIEKELISNYVIYNDIIYYTASTDKYSDVGYPYYNLNSYNIKTKEKQTIHEYINVFYTTNGNLMIVDNKVYFSAHDADLVEYNTLTTEKKYILNNDYKENYVFNSNIILHNDVLFYERKDDSIGSGWEIYKSGGNDVQKNMFTQNNRSDMLISTNVTDNYIFFVYTLIDGDNLGAVSVYRMKHDSSELVKLYDIPTRYVSNLPSSKIYIVEDKIFIYNFSERIEKDKIIVIDFDGNQLDWDI